MQQLSKSANGCEHSSHLCVPKGVCLDGTQTAPTPAMWAPTCRTRQPRSSCPGWRPAEAGESEPDPSSRCPHRLCCHFSVCANHFFIMKLNVSQKKKKKNNKERKPVKDVLWKCRNSPENDDVLCVSILYGSVSQSPHLRFLFHGFVRMCHVFR